jgi:hypothetical protein
MSASPKGLLNNRTVIKMIYVILLIGNVKESEEKDIKQTRRRLSVMSDNKLVEGFDSVNLDGDEEVKGNFN